jgi:hypothetical protein
VLVVQLATILLLLLTAVSGWVKCNSLLTLFARLSCDFIRLPSLFIYFISADGSNGLYHWNGTASLVFFLSFLFGPIFFPTHFIL